MKFYRKQNRELVPHHESALTRRDFLMRAGGGVSGLALASLLGADRAFAAPANPLAAKVGHYAGTAKQVIFLVFADIEQQRRRMRHVDLLQGAFQPPGRAT